MDIKRAFGTVLRDYRKRVNLSQEKIALECDLDRAFISLLERGQRQPTLTTLFQLSEVLKVPAAELITETQNLIKPLTIPPLKSERSGVSKRVIVVADNDVIEQTDSE
jgi:transcriptional regulator with XRE-family HTH domain